MTRFCCFISAKKCIFQKRKKKLSLCLTHSPPGNFAERCVWKLVERFSGWSLPGRTKTYHKAVCKSDASQPSDPSAVRGRIGLRQKKKQGKTKTEVNFIHPCSPSKWNRKFFPHRDIFISISLGNNFVYTCTRPLGLVFFPAHFLFWLSPHLNAWNKNIKWFKSLLSINFCDTQFGIYGGHSSRKDFIVFNLFPWRDWSWTIL